MTNTGRYSEDSALNMLQGGGFITFQKGSINVINTHGLSLQGNDNNIAHIKNSTVMVRNPAFNGMRFFWGKLYLMEKKQSYPDKGLSI
ncbi:hypothetical protein MCO_01717 [Bartonella sp. DB5-6]|nr:hypothetical protein MCO_01717 [Bartonella sp. DB5-6]